MSCPALFARSLLFFILLILITIFWSILCMLTMPFFPYRQRYWIALRWSVMVIGLAKVICKIRYQIIGQENFPNQPAIVLSKHQSAWETIAYALITPRPLSFVSKRELSYIPFFGWVYGSLRMIAIDRSKGQDAFAQVVEQGRKRLADGQWIMMFPEATRIAVGQKGYYKTGGARLAVETNTLVVPMAINSGNCWPRRSFIKYPGLITVSIGKPISPQGKSAQELMQEVETWIEAEMRKISPHNY